MVSAESPKENPAVQPVPGAVPLLATVNCTWKPPGQELTIDAVSAQVPGEPVVVGVGEGLGDPVVGDGLGPGEPELVL